MNGQDLAEAITDSVNSGIDVEEFQDGLRRSHNALQSRTFNEVLKPGMVALASTKYVDRRNKNSVRQAQVVCDTMGWDY